jgi:hypothetical protein
MATENILIKFTSDTSGLKDSVAELQKIGKLSDEDAKKFQMMEGFAEGVADALKEAGIDAKTLNKEVTSAANSGKSLKAQFSDAKNEAVKLSREFGATSVQARNAAKSAALLKDEIDDMNGVLKALNPEAKLNAFVNLGQGVQGAFQAATGALQVFGIENERITKLAQQFQGVLNLTQGINSVLQLKDVYTQLKLVLGVTTVAQEGLKAATIATTVAEEGAVVATNALNVSLKSLLVTAGPYLIALAILGVAINELNKSYEKEAKANKDSRDEIERKRLVLIETANSYINLAESSSKYLEIAKEQGATDLELLALQLKTNESSLEWLKIAQQTAEQAQRNSEQQNLIDNKIKENLEDNLILRLKIGNEIERIALASLRAAQAQRDIEAAATKSLKAQFDSEFQGRLQVFDETLELSKIVNEIISKDASDRIKRDLVSEIDFLEKKLKETEETQKQDLANFKYYEKEKEIIRAKLARTKKELTGQEDKDDKEAQDKKEAIRQEIFENTQQLNSSLLGFTQALNEREIQGLEEKKKQGLISEEKYQQEIKKIQSRAAAAEKQSAIFSALIGIANGIINATNSKTVPVPVAVAIAAAIGAAQLATIIATPIPRFKEGTLNVGGGSLDSDGGMQAIIHRGEAIIPADRNREYHPTIKALYNRQVKASEINSFVQNKLSGKMNHNVNAKINTKELARAMSGSENVNIKNSNILAKQIGREIAGNINRRRS